MINRYGRAVAALVSAKDLATIEHLRAAKPQEGLASLAGGWAGSTKLVAAIASLPHVVRAAKRRSRS